MSMMTIELRKERNEARHQSTCIHMVTYCKTRWVRSRSPTMLSICLVNHLMSKRQSVLYFPYSTLFSWVKGHKGSPVLPRLLPCIVMGSLLRRAHFESLRAAEAKNSATINRSNISIVLAHALRKILHSGRGLGQIKHCRPRAIFALMHSHGIYFN